MKLSAPDCDARTDHPLVIIGIVSVSSHCCRSLRSAVSVLNLTLQQRIGPRSCGHQLCVSILWVVVGSALICCIVLSTELPISLFVVGFAVASILFSIPSSSSRCTSVKAKLNQHRLLHRCCGGSNHAKIGGLLCCYNLIILLL